MIPEAVAPDCRCPVAPDLSEITNVDEISGDPIACACCGRPLELTCGGKCSKRHQHQLLREANARAAAREKMLAKPERIRRAERDPSRPKIVFHFKPKLCACGTTFAPTGGRDTRCPACKGTRANA